jgi:hypothetical protein
MDDECWKEKVWKEAVVTHFKEITQAMRGRTEENQEQILLRSINVRDEIGTRHLSKCQAIDPTAAWASLFCFSIDGSTIEFLQLLWDW